MFDKELMERLKREYGLLYLFLVYFSDFNDHGAVALTYGRLIIDPEGEPLTATKCAVAIRLPGTTLEYFVSASEELKQLETNLLKGRYGAVELASLNELAGDLLTGMATLMAKYGQDPTLIMNFDSEEEEACAASERTWEGQKKPSLH